MEKKTKTPCLSITIILVLLTLAIVFPPYGQALGVLSLFFIWLALKLGVVALVLCGAFAVFCLLMPALARKRR